MSRKFRTAFGRVLSCGKNQGDFYSRWPNGRTNTTVATPSTPLPSSGTLLNRGPNSSTNRRKVVPPSTTSFKIKTSSGFVGGTPTACTDMQSFRTSPTNMTYYEVVVDTNAADTSGSPSARTRSAADAITQV